eukprot:3938581-Rhodomonas_salina.2
MPSDVTACSSWSFYLSVSCSAHFRDDGAACSFATPRPHPMPNCLGSLRIRFPGCTAHTSYAPPRRSSSPFPPARRTMNESASHQAEDRSIWCSETICVCRNSQVFPLAL